MKSINKSGGRISL